MAEIFISYAHEDLAAVQRLAAELEKRGWPVFWDRRIPAGRSFVDVIVEQLGAAKCVLALWSTAANASGWVREEADEALKRNILVPVLIEKTEPPFGFRQIHAASLIGWQGESAHGGFQQLLEDIERHVPASPRGPSKPSPGAKADAHLLVGDRFARLGRLKEAVEEYKRVLETDPDSGEAYRRMFSASRDRLLLQAFGPNSWSDIALWDYDCYSRDLVPPADATAALTILYRLQAIEPALATDVEFLLDEARILKAAKRLGEAALVLEGAAELVPDRADVLAELGLVRTLSSEPANEEHLTLIQRAIESARGEARYHFYVARALFHIAKRGSIGSAGGKAMAESIREYHRAADLAAGADVWSRQIRTRAPYCILEIFHHCARQDGSILTPQLTMPYEERLRELQYALAQGPGSGDRSGEHDFPEFWLAALYHATGDLGKAESQIRELMEEDYRSRLPGGGNFWEDKEHLNQRPVYTGLFLKILEERRNDPATLARIRFLLDLG